MKAMQSSDYLSPLVRDGDRELETQLALIASLSFHLSRLPLREGLSLALDALLKVTRAEAAELFLREPVTGDIVLAAHQGPFRKAFFQATHFHPGEGYPGIVAVKKEPIFTTQVQSDPRYLRTRVKEMGFRSYLCIPMQVGDEMVGSLNIASRESRKDFPSYQRLLSWAASSIATAVRLRFYEVEKLFESTITQISREADGNLDSMLKELLNNLAALSEADTLAVVLYDSKSQKLKNLAIKGSKEKDICVSELASNCPAISKAQVILIKHGKEKEAVPYHPLPYGQVLRICMPFMVDKKPLGVIQLGYKKLPQPPTRDVALVASAASQIASLLITNWYNHKEKDNIIRATRSWLSDDLVKDAGAAFSSMARNASISTSVAAKEKQGHVLEVRCMGTFQVFLDGELIPAHRFTRSKAVSLLKILAIKRGNPVPADAIAEHLWPNQNPDMTAHNLEVVASELRRIVDIRSKDKGWHFIQSYKGSYALHLSPVCLLDLDEYYRLLYRVKILKAAGKDEERLVLFQEMDNLYRGDLLEDEPYAEWCWMERETLRETHLDILRQIALLQVQKGNLESAIQHYRKALRLDPLREELHRQLIQTLLKAERRDEALRQYLRCCDILKQELDIDPSKETRALHKILINNKS